MGYHIPLFDLNYDIEEEKAVIEVLHSRWISSGEKCKELESMFCDGWKVSEAIAVTNCTAALHLSLLAIGIQNGDEVIVPSYTFVATVNAIRYAGATPVFCDIINSKEPTIDPEKVKTLITSKTKAVIVMHYAGFPCRMDEIMRIARKYNLRIVEDACHGPLSEYKGVKLGTIGDVGCFSFFSNKNISTGEGGMVITNNSKYAQELRLLRSHGMTTMSYERAKGHSTDYDVVCIGYNYRLDDIRAALGIVQLGKLRNDILKRAQIRSWYLKKLNAMVGITVPFLLNDEYVSNYIMPIVLINSTAEKRNVVRSRLAQDGIQTSVHYPAVHRFSIYQNMKGISLNQTEYMADCEITLPMFGKLTEMQVDYICNRLNKALEEI